MQHLPGLLPQVHVDGSLVRCEHSAVFDEVAEMRIPSSPIGVSSEIGTCMILRTLRSLAAGMSMRLAISNEVGSRPNSWISCRETRISLLTISTMCTGSRMVRA